MSELRDRLSAERRRVTESSQYFQKENDKVFFEGGAALEEGSEHVSDLDVQERYQEVTTRKGMRNAEHRSAPHQRRRVSVPDGIGIVGKSYAYPTYPCREA